MKPHVLLFEAFLNEATDPSYFQETFYFTVLLSMLKDQGGSRDETKNDIRALAEVLTVTLVESSKGGVQRDIGTKYLTTLKLHARLPKGVNKRVMIKGLVEQIGGLRGVNVLRYQERKPKQRRKPFYGKLSITESKWPKTPTNTSEHPRMKKRLIGNGGNTHTGGGTGHTGPDMTRSPSAPALEEALLDEAMMGPGDLPEGIIVVVRPLESDGFRIYYAHRDDPKRSLKAGDLDRMEAGIDIFGVLQTSLGRREPYAGTYMVTSVKATDGFGPLLYDVALELAGENGLKPNASSVSDDASAVWKHYNTQRDDVTSEPLVEPYAYDSVMPTERAAKPEENEHLSHKYTKTNRSTIQDLIDQGKYLDWSEGEPAPPSDPREELTDLAGELDIPIVKDLSRFDRLYEDVIINIGGATNISSLMAFDIQQELQQKIWNGEDSVHPGVKGALMSIVDEFIEDLDLAIDVKDVIITGSIANYNWSQYSDIDIHILVDFADVNENEEMVKKFFDAVRSNWNKLHNIMVKGHEVEIYIQNEHEPHISTGVYSLMNDRWLVVPKKVSPAIDQHTTTKKMKALSREIEKLSGIFDTGQSDKALQMAEKLKSKIKRMRQSGLEKSGIYSPENLAFKMLRRSGDIEQLFSIYTQAYDQVHSLDQ